jgi:hypothetical protein
MSQDDTQNENERLRKELERKREELASARIAADLEVRKGNVKQENTEYILAIAIIFMLSFAALLWEAIHR